MRRFGVFVGFEFARSQRESFYAVGEFCDRFYSVIVPRTAFGVIETEHEVHSENVRSVLIYISIGGNYVSAGFAHSVTVGS